MNYANDPMINAESVEPNDIRIGCGKCTMLSRNSPQVVISDFSEPPQRGFIGVLDNYVSEDPYFGVL